MPFDEYGMSGSGTLSEYFTHKPFDTDETLGGLVDPDFEAEINDRDSAIDRLCLELFADRSGLARTETMQMFWEDEEAAYTGNPDDDLANERASRRERRKLLAKTKVPGLVMIGIQSDDPILALYKDGKPVAAFYASYRGIYQAGGYVAEGDAHFFAHNFADSTPQDTWIEDYEAGCSQIARDFLLGRRTY